MKFLRDEKSGKAGCNKVNNDFKLVLQQTLRVVGRQVALFLLLAPYDSYLSVADYDRENRMKR